MIVHETPGAKNDVEEQEESIVVGPESPICGGCGALWVKAVGKIRAKGGFSEGKERRCSAWTFG